MIKTFVAIAAGTLLFAGAAAAQVTALTHVTVIDGTGAPPRNDVTVVMENGRIRDMGPAATTPIPSGAAVTDMSGKFVVPGIINAHGHVGANPVPQLRQYALYGVTTTTSMATDPDEVVQVREEQKRGNLRGARVLTVKYRFWPDPEVATPEQARARVDEIAPVADIVKIWVDGLNGTRAKLTPEFTAAVLEQAHKHGKITLAHVYEYVDAQRVVSQGANVLAHNIRDREVDAEFIEVLKRRNVSVISTLIREEAMFAYGQAPAWVDEPFFRKGVPPEHVATIKTEKRAEQANDPNLARYRRAIEIDQINIKKLADGGVRMAFGTDSGGARTRFFMQGYFEHRQMELMIKAGLTPMQVIQSFSKGSSEALGLDRDFGTLAKGKAADLLVLDRNPLDDITNMRALHAVYLGGRKFE